MDATNNVLFLIIFSIFVLALAWYSYLVWFKPEVYVKWMKTYRSRFYRLPIGSLGKKMYGNQLDRNPKLDLWWTRIGLFFVYMLVIYVISIYVGGSR